MERRKVGLHGRNAELQAVLSALQEAGAPVLDLSGPAGIGKTALCHAVVDDLERSGRRVLRTTPAESEALLAFVGLFDLVGPLLPELEQLPRPARRALESALLLREPDGGPVEPMAVATGFLGLIRLAAVGAPLVMVIDDVQWLDAPSATAIGFVLRRLTGDPDLRVSVLLARRSGWQVPVGLRLPSERVRHLELGGLDVLTTHRLVVERTGRRLSGVTLRRVHEQSGGNPLHAIELAEALSHDLTVGPGGTDFVPSEDLLELIRRHLAGFPPAVWDALAVMAATRKATAEVVAAVLSDLPDAGLDSLAAAKRAGLVTERNGQLRFAHPLYASACYQMIGLAGRRRIHLRLANVLEDPDERARHVALAADGPDPQVAAVLDTAARRARARGAPEIAADLAELARRLTPVADDAELTRRALQLSRYLIEAGDATGARRTLTERIDGVAPGPARTGLLAALAAVCYEHEGPAAAAVIGRQALQEAGADRRAAVEARLVLAGLSDLPGPERRDHARRALDALEELPDADPVALSTVLREISLGSYHSGEGMPDHLMQKAAAIEDGLAEPPPVAWRARTILGECLKYLDRFEEADTLLRASQSLAEDEGDAGSMGEILGHRAELALWTGSWEEAAALADLGLEAVRASSQTGREGTALYFKALVAAHRGDPTAAADAESALEIARLTGNRWAEHLAHSVLGFIAVAASDLGAAAGHLERCDKYASEGVRSEPRQWRYLGDYIEALVATGRLDLAADRLIPLRHWADGSANRWAGAVLARSEALVSEAAGDRPAAVGRLMEAAELLGTLPLPFEKARNQMLLGTVLRRQRKRSPARLALESALDGFQRLGSVTWTARTRSEIERLGGRRPAGDELTPSERAVAELVGRGLANKEVAAALSVTTRAVEAHLTRIYAKLGIRSRTELARRVP